MGYRPDQDDETEMAAAAVAAAQDDGVQVETGAALTAARKAQAVVRGGGLARR